MEKRSYMVPRMAIIGVSIGLLLMAFFTMWWAMLAESGFNGSDHWLVVIVSAIVCSFFIVYAIYFFVVSKRHSGIKTPYEKKEGKRIGMWYGIIFGLEGITIPLAIAAVQALHHDELIIPVTALVVGLHFYPMAMVFRRSIDYYLATWTCIVALSAIALLLTNTLPYNNVLCILGIGVGLATASYGIYMVLDGYRLIKPIEY